MKVLIAGGAGFIGSNLARELLKRGEEVVVVDNLVTGNLANIKDLKDNKRFKFFKNDVTKRLPREIKVDQIYHLASPASPSVSTIQSYHNLWHETMMVNTVGTWNLIDLALKNQTKFLFASTSEVYGDPLEHPQKESYRGNVSTTGPRAVYDEAKRFGETIVSANVRKMNLDGRIVRIFNTYGPGMDLTEGRVVYNFLIQALKGEPIVIHGDGSQTRSFCYISDQVAGLLALMNKPNLAGEVVNIGNPQEFTIKELAEKIIKLVGSKSKLIYKPLPTDDPTRRKPDISKAKDLLNWEPRVELDEGLLLTLGYVKKVLRPTLAKRISE